MLRSIPLTLAMLAPVMLLGLVLSRYHSEPRFSAPPPHSLYAASRKPAISLNAEQDQRAVEYLATATPVSRLTPFPNGPGLVVCDPASREPQMADFATGCGRWLHLAAAGQPDLDRTPSIEDTSRAVLELGKKDLALTAREAFQLLPITGATHAAVGSLQGSPGHCTLVYHLWDLSTHKRIGPPITITGSQDTILQGLPAIARQLDGRLGVSRPLVTLQASPEELSLLGRCAWLYQQEPSAAEVAALRKLATRNPLAGLYLLTFDVSENDADWEQIIARLLHQAPLNTLVLSTIAVTAPRSLNRHWASFSTSLGRHPHNFLLNLCRLMRDRGEYQEHPEGGIVVPIPDERGAAEQVVQSDFYNPGAWLILCLTIANQAHAVRMGVFSGQMDPIQEAFTRKAYPDWVTTARRAAALDPGYAKAWLRLSTAAAFNGEAALAETALWKAIRLDSQNSEIYWWGIQLHQPKWFDDPVKLARVAQAAAAAHYHGAGDAISMAHALQRSGFPDLAKRLLLRVEQEYRALAKKGPQDQKAWYGLAGALGEQGRFGEAVPAYREVLRLRPDDSNAHYYLARALEKSAHPDEAMREYRQAVRLSPGYQDALAAIGRLSLRGKHYVAQPIERF